MVRHFGPGEVQVVARDGKELFIHLRGRFRVTTADGTEIRISSKRARALLALLSLAPGFRSTRHGIGPQLWSNGSDDEDGDSQPNELSAVSVQLKNLRQLLVTLRKQLGPDASRAIGSDNEAVYLLPSLVWIDVFAERAAIGSLDDMLPDWVTQNLPLLDGFARLGKDFDEWAANEARDYRASKAHALTRRGEAIEKRAPPIERQVGEYRALADCAPEDERFCQRLMELIATTGQGGLAEIGRIFSRCKAAVEADTGDTVQLDTAGAYERACAMVQASSKELGGGAGGLVAVTGRSAGDWVPAECGTLRERPVRLDDQICIGVRPLHNLTGESALDRFSVQLNRNIMTDIGMLARPFSLIELPPTGAPPVPRQSHCDYIVAMTLEVERRQDDPQVAINLALTGGWREATPRTNRASYPLALALDCRRPLSARIAGKIYFDLITEHALRLEGNADAQLSVAELLALGMAMLSRRNTPTNLWAAMRYFGSALVRDGSNVDALAGAAHVYHRLATQPSFSDNPIEAARRGMACIETALDRDRNHLRANYVSGLLSSVQGEPQRAEATFEYLLDLSSHLPALAYRAYNRCFLDQPGVGLEELRHIVASQHVDPSAPIYLFFQGFSEAHCGDFTGAIQSLRRSLYVDPTYPSAKIWLAACEH
ncbi:MAG: hypothetical protein ABL904_21425, partial [Hyphomicrobiaceae bacterium]